MRITECMSTADLDALTAEALATALWIGLDWGDDPREEPRPLDESYSVEDVSDEAREDLRERLAAFVANYWEDVSAYLEQRSLGALGHDYILTRNHHGAGFWDRGLGALGDRLTDAAHADGDWDLYVGDDGRLYANG